MRKFITTWTLMALAAAAANANAIWSHTTSDRSRASVSRTLANFNQTATDLVSTLGFDGVIHRFKNCVIRPDEPEYCASTREYADRAQELVSELETIARDAGLEVTYPSTREMISAYRDRSSEVEAMHQQGVSIEEIDDEVRWDDTPAQIEIDETMVAIEELGREQNASITRAQLLQSLLGLALLVGAALLAIRQFGRERDIAKRLEFENQLQTMMDAAANSMMALNKDREIIMINPAGRHLLGGIRKETPFPWPENICFLDAQDLQPMDLEQDPISRSLNGKALRGEVNLMSRARDTVARYVRVSSNPVKDPKSSIAIVVDLDDVSIEENNRQKLERRSRLDALGQLTGGIAHDFNNLLGTVYYSVELLRREDLTDPGRKAVEAAVYSVTRGTALTNRLLAFARRQPGLAASRSVGDFLDTTKVLVQATVEKTISIDFAAEDPDLLVYCDQAQLDNAVVNLIINSRDAIVRSGKGDRIRVSVRGLDELDSGLDELVSTTDGTYFGEGRRASHEADRDRDDGSVSRYVEVAVSDNGPGMTEEVKRRAVDPFFTTKDANSGTGLGLSMVFGFVQQADGEMRIYTEEGKGTTVRLLLPRGTLEDKRELPVGRVPVTKGHGERILIVEDELPLLEMIDETLRGAGYTTLTARSGNEALTLLKEDTHFDLLLTDIVMPGGIDGFELASVTKAKRPDIAVLYMSGYTGYTEVDMGAVPAALVSKPSSPGELTAAVQQTLKNN